MRATANADVYGLEKGWYPGNLASDPNPTLDGVTDTTYKRFRRKWKLPPQSVRLMTEAERVAIYDAYYDDAHADLLPAPLDALHHAFGFNAGPAEAVRALQRAVGVDDDGKVGPLTRAAVANAVRVPGALFYAILREQLRHYRHLIANKRLAPNARSWIGRLLTLAEKYHPTLFP